MRLSQQPAAQRSLVALGFSRVDLSARSARRALVARVRLLPTDVPCTHTRTAQIQINTPVTPELRAKRSRDDFLSFSVNYSNGQTVAYGVQMKARKNADQLLVALNSATKGKAG